MVAKLERVPLRDSWKTEPEFTAWLEGNIDALSDVLDLQLSNVEREQKAGAFSVDLVAEDKDGQLVVIENQLEKSNHDHLGKLITYLTTLGANTGVWIVSDPRPDHVRAISWLNESSSASFFLLKVESVRIGGSDTAPLLTLITGPSEEAREAGETKRELAERYEIRQRFWKGLLERSKEKTKLFSAISPSQVGWIATGAGISGVSFTYTIRQHDAQVEVYIDRGRGADDENKAIFDHLKKSKKTIETIFKGQLEWQRLNNKRGCRIRKICPNGGWRDEEEKWPKAQDTLIVAMTNLHNAFKTPIRKLKI